MNRFAAMRIKKWADLNGVATTRTEKWAYFNGVAAARNGKIVKILRRHSCENYSLFIVQGALSE